MSQEDELASVREQVSILAEQVGTLLHVIFRQDRARADTGSAEDKMAVLESLMWKLHKRHSRLKAAGNLIH